MNYQTEVRSLAAEIQAQQPELSYVAALIQANRELPELLDVDPETRYRPARVVLLDAIELMRLTDR